jgi:ubiquinone/menaquinone biosynthesis C-methylase UbiE
MEADVEAYRLEEQVYQQNYSFIQELQHLTFSADEVTLDAGCGTGVLSRYLVEHFNVKHIDALDFSDLRLQQAKMLLNSRTGQSIHFHRQDITSLEPEFYNHYDTVISRFVIEHLQQPQKAVNEMVKCLKPGGRLIISELDGVFLNLYSENETFQEYMAEFIQKIKFDPLIGRKVPSMMKRAGLMKIQWEATLAPCQGPSLVEEVENSQKRFAALKPFLLEIFGESKAASFRDIYLQELQKEENTLVFTKYVCVGLKP